MTKNQKLANHKTRWYWMRLIATVVIAVIFSAAHAQEKTIEGVIKGKDGEPVVAASISVKDTKIGTATDAEGKFRLTLPASLEKPVLVVSALNFQTAEMRLGAGQQTVELALDRKEKSMDEIIVTGYTNQKKGNVTGSVGVVSGKQLMDVASPNVSNLLQGKVAGVEVVNASGRPGSTPAITIRGRSTINSTTAPLWVVDGAIMSTEPVLNPADIESMSVLKDASSAALYGSRAANGVIVVTTKMAKGADRSDFSVSGKLGVTQFSMGKFQLMNSGQIYDYWKSFANQNAIPAYFNESLKQRNTNWLDIGSQNALTQDYNLSYSGVSGRAKIYSGINFYDEGGTVKGYKYNRVSGRLNVDYKLTNKLTFKPKIAVSFAKTDSTEHSIYDMYRNMPWDQPYDSAGRPVNARASGVTWYGRDLNNYLYDLQWNFTRGQTLSINSSADFQYDFNEHFSFKSTNNITYRADNGLGYIDPRSNAGLADIGRISNTAGRATSRFTNQMLTYKTDIGEHSISALAAYEYNDYTYNTNISTGKGIVPGVTVLNGAATPIAASGNITQYAFRSYLFNAAYSYSNRYSLQGSVRSDGSSRFSKKYGTFYSIGGAWNVHNESFFNVAAINYLRVRANYGGTGNTPSDYYGYYDLFGLSTQYNGSPSAFPTALGNKTLSWEKTYSTDAGVEIGLFDRLNLTVDLYRRNTSDLVYAVALPSVSGYVQQLQNIGAVVNKGIEATLSYAIIKSSKVQWNLDVTIGSNKNHVTELYKGQSQLNGNQVYKEGYDINTWYLPVWAGVNPDNGNPQWEVADASGNKTLTGTYSAATLQAGAAATPKYFGGINTNVSWAGLSLRVNTAFRKGSMIYYSDRETFDADGAYPTYNSMVLKSGWSRWTPENHNATHPLAYYGGNNNSNKPSTRYLEDGSFFRIRNITLGYSLPAYVVQKLKSKNIQANISFDNLLTLTKFSGLDPETIAYPQPKRIMFGLSIGF